MAAIKPAAAPSEAGANNNKRTYGLVEPDTVAAAAMIGIFTPFFFLFQQWRACGKASSME